jgi:hypothetical protein
VKARNTTLPPSPRPDPPHPLEAQLILYRAAIERMKAQAAAPDPPPIPVIEEMVAES